MTTDTTLPVTAVLAAVPVRDADAAQMFYEQLLGAAPGDSPMPGLSQWDLGGGVLQVVIDVDRAGGVVKAVAQVIDPDGNAITLVQA